MNVQNAIILAFLALAAAPGCTHAISEEVLNETNFGISFAALLSDPEAYAGETVLLGGVMVEAINRPEDTVLEIAATRLGSGGRPVNPDNTGGRFLAFNPGYLDCDVYRKGRRVTLAGVVTGSETRKLGEADYRYPCVQVREIHIWKVEQPRHYYHPYMYPPPFYYGPYYGHMRLHCGYRWH